MKREQSVLEYLKSLHEAAKMNASYERYQQDTVHDWEPQCAAGWMPGEDAPQPPRWIRWAPLAVIVGYWRIKGWLSRFYLAHLIEILWLEFLRVMICGKWGHDLEDTGSWANGDSGGEDMTCRRCGFHFHHTYY